MAKESEAHANIRSTLGRHARDARRRAGYTQADVAELIGLSTEVYGRLERGRMMPSVPTLRALCAALQLDANLLLGLSVTPPKASPELSLPSAAGTAPLRRLVRKARELKPPHQRLLLRFAAALAERPRNMRTGARQGKRPTS